MNPEHWEEELQSMKSIYGWLFCSLLFFTTWLLVGLCANHNLIETSQMTVEKLIYLWVDDKSLAVCLIYCLSSRLRVVGFKTPCQSLSLCLQLNALFLNIFFIEQFFLLIHSYLLPVFKTWSTLLPLNLKVRLISETFLCISKAFISIFRLAIDSFHFLKSNAMSWVVFIISWNWLCFHSLQRIIYSYRL